LEEEKEAVSSMDRVTATAEKAQRKARRQRKRDAKKIGAAIKKAESEVDNSIHVPLSPTLLVQDTVASSLLVQDTVASAHSLPVVANPKKRKEIETFSASMTCRRCCETKPTSSFGVRDGGFRKQCKDCQNAVRTANKKAKAGARVL
jgi:hypothetical protein